MKKSKNANRPPKVKLSYNETGIDLIVCEGKDSYRLHMSPTLEPELTSQKFKSIRDILIKIIPEKDKLEVFRELRGEEDEYGNDIVRVRASRELFKNNK